MTKNLLQIEIIFENTDYAIIPVKNILQFNISNISEFYRIVRKKEKLITYTGKHAKDIYLILDKKIKVKTAYEENLLERILSYNDIVTFILHFDDDSIEEIYTNWIDNKDNNLFQTSYINDQKDLVISIKS